MMNNNTFEYREQKIPFGKNEKNGIKSILLLSAPCLSGSNQFGSRVFISLRQVEITRHAKSPP